MIQKLVVFIGNILGNTPVHQVLKSRWFPIPDIVNSTGESRSNIISAIDDGFVKEIVDGQEKVFSN